MCKNMKSFSQSQIFLSLFFALLCALFSLDVHAQSDKVTIKRYNVAVKTVLNDIESQTHYLFIYGQEVNVSRKVTVNVKNQPVSKVLHLLFGGQHVKYSTKGDHIVLSDEPANSVKSTGKNPDLVMPSKTVRVSGHVLDSNGDPIIGATVTAEGTNVRTVTNIDGEYMLDVPENVNKLEVSFIGFTTQHLIIGGKEKISVVLKEESNSLNEVVVVGYGMQKKVNLTGAISTLDPKQIADRPITSSTQALQGIRGIYVNQAGAQPGTDGATIRVRGQGTLNDNSPLVLVDGIECTLDAVNPNDIESISVLKDAASSSIYGARAANGVILVKTKQGEEGRFSINYSSYYGFNRATYLPDFVYDPITFMEYRNQAQRNEGKLTVDYSDELIEEYREGMKTDPITYQNNNWLDIMFNDAFIMEQNIRFSGGNKKMKFSLSLGYMDQNGVLRGTDSNKYTLSANVSSQLTDKIKIGFNIIDYYNVWNAPVSGVANLMEMTFKATAFHPTYDAYGRYANTFIRTPGHNIYRHPLALADEGERNRKGLRTLTNLSLEYQLPFYIKYNMNVGINKYDFIQKIFAPEVYEYQLKTGEASKIVFDGQNVRHAYREDENDLSLTFYNTLNWEYTFPKSHYLHLLAGFSYQNDKTSIFTATKEGYLGNELTELDAGSTNGATSGSSTESRLMSFFGRVNYSYKDRYLFEANARYDGSSRFADGHKWGIFPSFSAGWRISEENFMKNINWINNLKLRISWGQLGNERIEMFRYVDLLDLTKTYPLNGTIQSGAAVTAYNDPNITWETTTMSNLGLDMLLFNSKLDFTFELFNKKTTDILRTVTLPAQVGNLTGPIRNIGDVSNKGYEIGIGYHDNIGGLNYSLDGSLTYIKNKIVSLKGQTIIDGKFILKEGEPIDSYYMLHCIGIFQSNEEVANSPFQTASTKAGYLKFEDVDHDGKITEADRKICGGVIPRYTYSFTVDFNYKGFDLMAFFQGVDHVYTYGDRIGATPFWFGCGLPKQWITDSWTPERGTSATLPILTTYEGGQNDNFRSNDFWLRDASYLRIKNIQLSYTFPMSVVKALKISALKLYVNVQNWFTFSNMDGFDPEKNLKNTNYYEYPSTKTFTAGINITF